MTETSTTRRADLTTGWEPDLDIADSMMRRFVENLVAQNGAIVRAGGGWAHRDHELAIADAGRPLAYYNAAVPLRPPVDWDGLMQRIEIGFGAGTGRVYLWSPWPTPDLSGRGWTKEGHPPFLLRPAGLPFDGGRTDAVMEVDDPTLLRRWEQVAIDGYPFEELRTAGTGRLFDPSLLGDARFRFFMSVSRGTPTAVAAQFVEAGLASFALGVTVPERRHEGHWRQLVAARLASEPCLPASGVFSDYSRRGAQAAGFLPIQRLTLWSRPRP